MSEAFRVQVTIDGDATRAKAAVQDTAAAVKGLSTVTKDAATAATTHTRATEAEVTAVHRLGAAEAGVAGQIAKVNTQLSLVERNAFAGGGGMRLFGQQLS